MPDELPSFPALVLRTEKGSALTHAEMDGDLSAIRSYIVMLAELFGVALNPDGTLNADSVTTISILNRQVTEAKLGPVSVFPTKQDTGTTNAISIALVPPLTAYADGQVFFVKVLNTNTGAVTLNVDSIGAIAIKKRGVVDLEAGDYDGGSLIVLGYFGGFFHLLSGTSSSTSSSSSSAGGFSGFQVYEPTDVAIPPAAAVAASGTLTGSANPADGDTVTIDSGGTVKVYRFKTVMAAAYDVQLHATLLATTLANLKAAIDASGTPGVEYFAGTLAHTTVDGSTLTATSLTVVATTSGIGGNAIATTETSSVLSWGATTLTGGITDSFTNFTHGFSTAPTEYAAYLINTATDLGFNVGDIINVNDFTDPAGLPAFTVSVNSTNVRVERHPASIELGGLGAITTTKWLLRVRASIKTNAGTSVFPALTFSVRNPQGAFSNGNDLFIVNSGATGVTYFNRISLSTNNATRLENPASGPNPIYCNGAPFLKADASQHVVFTSSTGIYSLPYLEVASPLWKPLQLTNAVVVYYSWKPVHIVESSGITHVYIVPGSYSPFYAINSLPLNEVTISSGAVVAIGTNIDLTSASILNSDGVTPANTIFRSWNQNPGFVHVLLFQYNKAKKRMYVITDETNLLHIFELTGTSGYTDPSSIVEWWLDAGRYGKLKYVKSISMAGDGAYSGDTNAQHIFVDIDLTTGTERAVVFNRIGGGNQGSVTRIPWRE